MGRLEQRMSKTLIKKQMFVTVTKANTVMIVTNGINEKVKNVKDLD